MGRHSDYKKVDELVAWDMDKGCRRIVNQSTPARRRLRDRLRRRARKRVERNGKRVEKDAADGQD